VRTNAPVTGMSPAHRACVARNGMQMTARDFSAPPEGRQNSLAGDATDNSITNARIGRPHMPSVQAATCVDRSAATYQMISLPSWTNCHSPWTLDKVKRAMSFDLRNRNAEDVPSLSECGLELRKALLSARETRRALHRRM
jgi:hypothetical protein